jgi:hypothetical protein
MTAAGTSANAPTTLVGSLDDADSVTIYLVSTAAATSTGAVMFLQVTQYDPALASSASVTGVTQSTAFHMLSSVIFSTGAGLVTSSGCAITISPINFRGMRIIGLSSATSGEPIAYVTKQIII